MFPREKVYLLGLFPLPAFWAIFLFVGLDLWGLLAQTEGGQLPIGHGAHLGGALAGGFFYLNYRSHFKFFSE
jgi:membrane associated rhomboid family serine protease